MITFKNLFLIIEGYSEVKNRLILNNVDTEDNIKNVLDFHRQYKKKYPTEMQNIDVYFSSRNQEATKQPSNNEALKNLFKDLIEKTAELEKELENTSLNIPKSEKINILINKLKIAENNDYILLKVNSHEEAKDLTRPGKDNPYGWPAQLPVTWCVAANSESGNSAYENYTNNKIPFFFAFKKFPKEVSEKTYMAIRSFGDGIFRYTPTPNGDEINEWPNVLPEKWKDIIMKNGGTLDKKYWGAGIWTDFLKQNPDKKELLEQYNVYEKFYAFDWLYHLKAFPKDKELLEKYNAYDRFDIPDWKNYLDLFPEDKKLIKKQYKEKISNLINNAVDWIEYLKIFPEDKHLVYDNGEIEYFEPDDWVSWLIAFPEDKDLAKQYHAYENFSGPDWLEYLEAYPKEKDLVAKQYNIYKHFSDGIWQHYLDLFPEDKHLLNQYNAYEEFNPDV